MKSAAHVSDGIVPAIVFGLLGFAAWVCSPSLSAGGMAAALCLAVCICYVRGSCGFAGRAVVVASLLGLAAISVLWIGMLTKDLDLLSGLKWLILPPATGWCLAAGISMLEGAVPDREGGGGFDGN